MNAEESSERKSRRSEEEGTNPLDGSLRKETRRPKTNEPAMTSEWSNRKKLDMRDCLHSVPLTLNLYSCNLSIAHSIQNIRTVRISVKLD